MNPECQNCPMRGEVERLREEVNSLQNKYSDSRQKIYSRLEALENERGRTDEQYKNIISDIAELKGQYKEILARLDELRQQPAKRWDSMVASGISAIIGALVGYMSTRLGG